MIVSGVLVLLMFGSAGTLRLYEVKFSVVHGPSPSAEGSLECDRKPLLFSLLSLLSNTYKYRDSYLRICKKNLSQAQSILSKLDLRFAAVVQSFNWRMRSLSASSGSAPMRLCPGRSVRSDSISDRTACNAAALFCSHSNFTV